MHIVNLSLDSQLMNHESVSSSRAMRYGEVVTSYTVIVPSEKSAKICLAENVLVYGVSGKKIRQFYSIYKLTYSLITQGRCDVITSQDGYYLGLLGLMLARITGVGLEVQVLGFEKRTWLRRCVFKFVVRRADSVRVLSRRLYRELKKNQGLTDDQMNLVPIYVDVTSLGFDSDKYSEGQKDKVIKAKKLFADKYGAYFNFVTVSRLVSVKNITLQIHSFSNIVQKYPYARLHIVGDGPELEKLVQLVDQLDMATYVYFHGAQYGLSLNPFFTQSDVFLLTSFSEGWGMVIVEAALANLPIIMTDVGCAGELIVHEQSGLVVSGQQSLVCAMTSMLNNEEQRLQYAQQAKINTMALPTFEELLEKYTMSWKQAYKNAQT